MAKIVMMNVKKIFTIILIAIVSILVIMAFYSNRHKFVNVETVKYMKVNISSPVSVSELADKYTDSGKKDRFVLELKKVNELSSTDKIENNTVLIPVFE